MSDPRSLIRDPYSRVAAPGAPLPAPCYACVYRPPVSEQPAVMGITLTELAQDFSPRFEWHRDDLVTFDVSGLGRLLGDASSIGEEVRRSAEARGLRVQVAVAATWTAAMVLAHARPGLTVVGGGAEASALGSVPIGILDKVPEHVSPDAESQLPIFRAWGLKTLGDLAALPPRGLAARVGRRGFLWQSLARGQDIRPLILSLSDERFESSIDLEWPIEGLEPLSFVLTRLLEPLSIRLERRDRGAAVVHVMLDLVKSPDRLSEDTYKRSLQLPAPIREVRAIRTLILLDLESHPPPAAIDRVTVFIEPTPGRVLQHTLFTRASPTPEQLSTLVARLNALMGEDRVGRAVLVDSYRPDAFEMRPFATEHDEPPVSGASRRTHPLPIASALRRCRHPVPARVSMADDKPGAVTTDRRGFAGGRVLACAGPWRTSGNWWSACGRSEAPEGSAAERRRRATASGGGVPRAVIKEGQEGESVPVRPIPPFQPFPPARPLPPWDRDEWDVWLSDGAIYRVFQDRESGGWFIDAIVD